MVCENDSDMYTLYLVTACSSTLSLIGNLFILVVYGLAKDLRVYAFKLVAYLAFCDSIKSISLMLPGYNFKGNFCSIQGFIMNSFNLSNLVWILAISFGLQKVIVKKHENIEIYHKYWIFLSFVACPVLTAMPFLSDGYGQYYSWCTLKVTGTAGIWRIGIDYIPRWCTILTILACYLRIYLHIRKNPLTFDEYTQHIFLKRMIGYPAVILVAFIPLTILRNLQTYGGECGYFWLAVVAYGCFGSYGLLNAIAYGYNDSIWQYVKGMCVKGNKISRTRGTDLFSTLSEGVIND